MRHSLWFAAPVLLAFPASALAHQPDNPEAHRSLPNQVFANVTPICNQRFEGSVEIDGEREDLGSDGVYCVGVTIGFAREVGRHFEFRWRVGYDKPYPTSPRLRDELHLLRATMALDYLAYALDDQLTVTVGPEGGLWTALLTEAAAGNGAARGFGFTVGLSAGVRTWVTYHTGLTWEVAAGYGRIQTDALELRGGFAGRISFGWADRF